MIEELGEAIEHIEQALRSIRAEREAWSKGAHTVALGCQREAIEILEALHADVMAWRCVLIVASRERDRARQARPSLIGRAWRRMTSTLL